MTRLLAGARRFAGGLRDDWNRKVLAPVLFGLGLLATFVSQLTLSYGVSAEAFGTYVLIYNAAAALSAVGAAGFDLSAVRYAALAKSRSDYAYLTAFLRKAVCWAALGCTTAIAAMAGFLFYSGKASPPILVMAAGIVLFWSFARVAAGVMRGTGLLSTALLTDRVLRDLLVMAAALAALSLSLQLDVRDAIALLLGGSFLSALAGTTLCLWVVYTLRPAATSSVAAPLDAAVQRDWFIISLGLMAYNLTELFASRFDIFALSHFSSVAAVGALGLAILLINLVTIPSAFLGLLVMPGVAVAYANNDRLQIRRTFGRMSVAAIGGGALISAVIIGALPYAAFLMPPAIGTQVRMDVLAAALMVRTISLLGAFPPVLLMMSGRYKALIGAHIASVTVRSAIYILFAAIIDVNLALLAMVAGSMVVTMVNLWHVRGWLTKLPIDGDGAATAPPQ